MKPKGPKGVRPLPYPSAEDPAAIPQSRNLEPGGKGHDLVTMVMKVSKSHFKAHALELLRRVEATGKPLIITDRGRPVLEVRPYREEDPRETLKGTLLHYQDPTEPPGEAWEVLG